MTLNENFVTGIENSQSSVCYLKFEMVLKTS